MMVRSCCGQFGCVVFWASAPPQMRDGVAILLLGNKVVVLLYGSKGLSTAFCISAPVNGTGGYPALFISAVNSGS